ncbi:MAG: AraC-like DNA-binding protein [Saprospiraceae bacterium]|jgi:AraC-like DNA-binding protein
MHFDLNPSKPIEVIVVNHLDINNHYFDMHYEFEIGVLISGQMKRSYLDCQIDLGPGDVWLCGMWEPHGFELVETPCEVVVFVISPGYLADCDFLNQNLLLPFQAPPLKRPKSHAQNRSELIALAQKTKMVNKKSNGSDWAKLHFFQLFLLLTELWTTPTTAYNFEQQESIQNALQLTFKQKRLIATKEAASACGMSITKFRGLFKAQMKTSFSDFALKYRVLGAQAQLKKTNDTQENVAHQWGFTDASHLHKYINILE